MNSSNIAPISDNGEPPAATDNEKNQPLIDRNLKCHRTWRVDDDTLFWQTYIIEAEKYDKEMVDGWRRALDNLLVFSGLFSAVNTAFIIETYKLLRPDPIEDTANMFRLFLKHRNDSYQFEDKDLDFSQIGSQRSAIHINSIFFASLSCSLLVAIGAVQGKDWLTQYDHNGMAAKPHSMQARIRQKKFDGLEQWGFQYFIALLPILLQVSLALFLVGVIVFLWEISREVAAVVMAFMVVGFLGFLASWIIAICYSSSPFQTPLSNPLHKPVVAVWAVVRNAVTKSGGFSASARWLRRTFGRRLVTLWTVLRNAVTKSRGASARMLPLWLRQTLGYQFKTFTLRCSNVLIGFMSWIGEPEDKPGGRSMQVLQMDYNKPQTSAECIGWLFEQAEQSDVVLRTLNVASLLPPNHVLAAFNKRVGLLDRLATLYNSHVKERAGRNHIPNPRETIITGIALFHVLKARLSRDFDRLQLPISENRIRHLPDPEGQDATLGKGETPPEHNDKAIDNNRIPPNEDTISEDSEVHRALAAVICCVEMLLPDSEGAETTSFKNCIRYISPESFKTPMTTKVSTSQTLGIPAFPSSTLSITIFPSGLLLDGLIACAVRHIQSDRWRIDWFDDYHVASILKHLVSVLDSPDHEPSEETISHIAIAMGAVRLAQRQPQGLLQKEERAGLSKILKAWYVVDKRATVFKNINLAFEMAGEIDTGDVNTEQIYISLLRFLDVYLPKGMEVSKSSDWSTWWPEAMNLYPGVLNFLRQIPGKVEPQIVDKVLHIFSRLLPDDWQYDDIREALLSQYTKESYPQLHALSPNFPNPNSPDNCADVLGLIIRSFVDTSGVRVPPSQEVQDSVIELLGWIVAYPSAKEHLSRYIESHMEYRYIPSFLGRTFTEQEVQVGPKTKEQDMKDLRYQMICRHAARHLHALAYMATEKETLANAVKLDSLFQIVKYPSLVSHLSGADDDEDYLQSLLFLLGVDEISERDRRDWALKEMMQTWREVQNHESSPERQFLLREDVFKGVIQYIEDIISEGDLESSDSQTVANALNYMDTARRIIPPENLPGTLGDIIPTLNNHVRRHQFHFNAHQDLRNRGVDNTMVLPP